MNHSISFYKGLERTKARIMELSQQNRTTLLCMALPFWAGSIESIEVHQVAWNLHANRCPDTLEILATFNAIA